MSAATAIRPSVATARADPNDGRCRRVCAFDIDGPTAADGPRWNSEPVATGRLHVDRHDVRDVRRWHLSGVWPTCGRAARLSAWRCGRQPPAEIDRGPPRDGRHPHRTCEPPWQLQREPQSAAVPTMDARPTVPDPSPYPTAADACLTARHSGRATPSPCPDARELCLPACWPVSSEMRFVAQRPAPGSTECHDQMVSPI